MPLLLKHAGIVLPTVQLVTITFDDYADRAQVEAFGNAIVGSAWYRSAGLEYGLNPGTHLPLTLGHAPKSLTRDQLEAQIKQLLTNNITSKPTTADAQPLYMLYERSTWHSAQHARQLIHVLERNGIEPNQRLSADDLAGLPLPERLFE